MIDTLKYHKYINDRKKISVKVKSKQITKEEGIKQLNDLDIKYNTK